MRTALIGCKTIKDEVEQILEEEGIRLVYRAYVQSGLHNSTDRLREALLRELAEIPEDSVDRLLLCFGLCGNVIESMKTGNYETVLPRTDDCITLLLGSRQRRQSLDAAHVSYYLTRGWLEGEANLHRNYLSACREYGREMADEIYRQIFEGYDSLSLIDTGRRDYRTFCQEGEKIARDLKLFPRCVRGDLSWLRAYLKQDYAALQQENKIVIYPPHSVMRWKDFVD